MINLGLCITDQGLYSLMTLRKEYEMVTVSHVTYSLVK
jgi:hypothetical protein